MDTLTGEEVCVTLPTLVTDVLTGEEVVTVCVIIFYRFFEFWMLSIFLTDIYVD